MFGHRYFGKRYFSTSYFGPNIVAGLSGQTFLTFNTHGQISATATIRGSTVLTFNGTGRLNLGLLRGSTALTFVTTGRTLSSFRSPFRFSTGGPFYDIYELTNN